MFVYAGDTTIAAIPQLVFVSAKVNEIIDNEVVEKKRETDQHDTNGLITGIYSW